MKRLKNILLFCFILGLTACKTPENPGISFNQLKRPPVGENSTIKTNEDQEVIFEYHVNEIEDVTDLKLSVVSEPKYGELKNCTNIQNNKIQCLYTPKSNFNGDDIIFFKTKNGDVDSKAKSHLIIRVLPVNDNPIPKSSKYRIEMGKPVELVFSADDIEGDQVYFNITNTEEKIKGQMEGCGRISKSQYKCTYTPFENFVGRSQIEFSVSNSEEFISSLSAITQIEVYDPDPCLTSSPPAYCSQVHLFKPSVAVRGAGCLMCHARIDGNLITDFGYGDDFFFGGNESLEKVGHGTNPFYKRNHFNNANGWSTAKINGNLIIPKTNVNTTDQAFVNFFNNPSVRDQEDLISEYNFKELLQLPMVTYQHQRKVMVTQKMEESYANVNFDSMEVGLYGKIIEKDNININSITEDEIVSLSLSHKVLKKNTLNTTKIISHKSNASISIDHFKIKDTTNRDLVIQGEDKSFVEINGDFHCHGDVFIIGRLHLDNVNLINQNTSCRIYTSKSIFITGQITYQNPESNLQLTSGRMILFGMKNIDVRSYGHLSRSRLLNTNEKLKAFFNDILYDGAIINLPENDAGPAIVLYTKNSTGKHEVSGYLSPKANKRNDHDSYLDLAGKPIPKDFIQSCHQSRDLTKECFLEWPGETLRKTIDYERLLVNAPTVWGRYYGKFKGIVIAEDALFAVGKFEFEYDKTFNTQEIIPLTLDKVFGVSDNISSSTGID